MMVFLFKDVNYVLKRSISWFLKKQTKVKGNKVHVARLAVSFLHS